RGGARLGVGDARVLLRLALAAEREAGGRERGVDLGVVGVEGERAAERRLGPRRILLEELHLSEAEPRLEELLVEGGRPLGLGARLVLALALDQEAAAVHVGGGVGGVERERALEGGERARDVDRRELGALQVGPAEALGLERFGGGEGGGALAAPVVRREQHP